MDNANFILHYGDMTDSTNLIRIIQEVQPDEIYNLAAQSHVKVAFSVPEYTVDVNALGALRLLEAIRILGLEKKTKFYQASTSELFGDTMEVPQDESTSFKPCSPYAIAKLYAYWCVDMYRKAYGMFACNGILFNHESERRGETFVTRKITKAAARITLGLQDKLYLGNLNSKRDWGYAKDYVRAMWLMLQQDKPEDFVIATGEQHSIREFCERAFDVFGIELEWKGEGVNEKGIINRVELKKRNNGGYTFLKSLSRLEVGQEVISVDPCYYRPIDVNNLLGNAVKAHRTLNWYPSISFNDMIWLMVNNDLKEVSDESKGHICPSCEADM